MLIPINFTGGDFQHKSRPLSNQITRNFWPQQIQTPKSKSTYILQTFFGLKEWINPVLTGACRGMLENQGVPYRVVGTKLYKFDSMGNHTVLGDIPGSNRCTLRALNKVIMILNGSGQLYLYNSEDSTMTRVTDVNLGSPRGSAVINNQAIYDDGEGQGFVVSDVGKPGVINGLNKASAENQSDNLVCPYGYNETLYLFGEKTIENWWNSGQGNPPFDRVQGSTTNVGILAIHSLADNSDYTFFLGTDYHIHTLTGGSSSVDTIISTDVMARQFSEYATVSDAFGLCMNVQGKRFYAITFPVQNITWVYPEGGEWFQWGSGSEGRTKTNSYITVFGKHLVGDYNSSKLFELDPNTYTDDGEAIIRTRQSAPIHGGLFNAAGLDFEISSIEVILESGNGLIEGQGSDPRLMISISKDGGKTFGTERQLKCGGLGQRRKVATMALGKYNECVIKLQVSDPIYWSIYSAVAYLEVCA